MSDGSRLRRVLEWFLDTGAYPGESTVMRGRRRIFVGALWLSLVIIGLIAIQRFAEGAPKAAMVGVEQFTLHLAVLFALRIWPRRIYLITFFVFTNAVLSELAASYLYGGILSAGVTVIWIMITVLINLILFGIRPALVWFGVFVAAIIATSWMESHVEATYSLTSPAVDAAINITLAMAVTVAVLAYFVVQRDHFQRESDDLLHNILPVAIADRLKSGEQPIADDVDQVTVLFADIVGFTPMSSGMSAADLIGLLNEVFSTFDELVATAGLEKIKTVGDEYMVAAGVPEQRDDHAPVIADLALGMRAAVSERTFGGRTISVRIGINSGPVAAGVIGKAKFSYDMWGDTVNTASRMQSAGVPGRIQITAATRALLLDGFTCEPRGVIELKGLEPMETWFLVSRA